MTLCEKCIHGEICAERDCMDEDDERAMGHCHRFKNKADFVKVVRCKDCKHCLDLIMGGMWCEHPDKIMPLGSNPDDFCSYGERRAEE